METFYQTYLEWLEKLHTDLKGSWDGLPEAALDWSPGDGMNSLAVLAVHTASSERYWIGDVALVDPAPRDRDAEFRTRGLDAQALSARLDSSLAYAHQNLAGMQLDDLAAARISPRNQLQVTCGWALLHALEHLAQHTAHAQLTRQLWEQKELRK